MKGVAINSSFLLFVWMLQSAFSQIQGQEGLNSGIQGLLSAMGTNMDDETHPFYSFTPSTPIPENINCYVEIPATRVGGQCVRLGRGRRTRGRGGRRRFTMGCQSGVHLDVGSQDCSGPITHHRRGGSRFSRVDG